jgi:hypothetical protein
MVRMKIQEYRSRSGARGVLPMQERREDATVSGEKKREPAVEAGSSKRQVGMVFVRPRVEDRPMKSAVRVIGVVVVGAAVGAVLAVPPPISQLAERAFIRGDANGDGQINIADPLATLNLLFGDSEHSGVDMLCLAASDVNDDGNVNIADAVSLLWYLFGGGPQPYSPFPASGMDPTDIGVPCWTDQVGPSAP